MKEAILALNAGSSSLKFGLYGLSDGEPDVSLLLRGSLSDADSAHPHLVVLDGSGGQVAREDWETGDLPARLLDWVEAALGPATLIAAGHRVVHGGRDFIRPVLIDRSVIARLEALTRLAPLHQPASLSLIQRLSERRSSLAQVACFDTAFHHRIGPPANLYALPRALEAEGVRRYGFHGLSYEAVARDLAGRSGNLAGERIVVAHLGSGASLCALRNLQSVDTTMGFSVLDGLIMGTRAGSLDPGILLYLLREKGFTLERLEQLLYHEAGLLGLSGLSADVRALLASQSKQAREALDAFALVAAKQIAAMATTLGGLERLVFTGGIGEYVWQVRAMIAERLAWLGVRLDPDANRKNEARISPPGALVVVEVFPTDEEGMIARHTRTAIERAAKRRA